MEHYVGLDVSLKLTAICVVDQTGSVMREGVVDSDPETIAEFVTSNAPSVVRIGLETGPTATWLWTELQQLGLPVICIDARHAKAVLKMQINKSDRNDAAGIARIMQTGWFKEVRVKDLDSHSVRALLASRALLVKIKRDLENQVRGLLKNLGLVIGGRAKLNVFAVRAEELIEDRPELIAAVRPLLDARKAIEQDGAWHRPNHGSLLPCDNRRPHSLQEVEKRRSLSRTDDPTIRIRRDRLDGPNLEMRRCDAAKLPIRGSQCPAHPRSKVVDAESLGHPACEAKRAPQSQGCRRSKACRHPAPNVDRRH
jgi:hypothetical protein